VCVCVCIRRFYCLYGDSMNVAARMSANAKESGVCVSPSIAAHLASAPAHADTHTHIQGHIATDVPSEELKRARMRVAEHETASDARAETLQTLSIQTPLDPSTRDTRVTSACATPRLCVVWRGVHVMSCRLISSNRSL
jgi:hypothetical protein